MNFLYILAGWEGFTYNLKVINLARAKGFEVLSNKYYIVDARYSNIFITLTPYRGVRYYFCK